MNPTPPLAGIRVLDLSRLLPGPYCTWLLRSMGAEVIHILPPGSSDLTAGVPPMVEGRSLFHACLHRGKRSMLLDTRRPEGLEILQRLLEDADVLVESFRPGRMAQSGLDPEELLQRQPRLIIASMSGYGQTGALADEPGHDLNFMSYSGLLSGRTPSEDASLPILQIGDLAGGAQQAALAITAALFARERHGRGQWLDCSITEGSLALMAPTMALRGAGVLPPGPSFLEGGLYNYGIYRCSDGRALCVGALEPGFQRRMEQALGHPLPESRAGMSELLLQRPRDAWVELFEGCCVSPALELDELAEHPLHKSRGAFESVLGVPLPRAGLPWRVETEPAPRPGQHGVEILESIGVDPAPLLDAGVLKLG